MWALEQQKIRPTAGRIPGVSGHTRPDSEESKTGAVDAGTGAVPVSAMLQAAATAAVCAPSNADGAAVIRTLPAPSASVRPPLSVSGARLPSPPKPPPGVGGSFEEHAVALLKLKSTPRSQQIEQGAPKADEAIVCSASTAAASPAATTATARVSAQGHSSASALAVAALMSLRDPAGVSRGARQFTMNDPPQPRNSAAVPEACGSTQPSSGISAPSSASGSIAPYPANRGAVKVVTASGSRAPTAACSDAASKTTVSGVVKVVTAASASSTAAAVSSDHNGGRDCGSGVLEQSSAALVQKPVHTASGVGGASKAVIGIGPGEINRGREEKHSGVEGKEKRDPVGDCGSNDDIAELLVGLSQPASLGKTGAGAPEAQAMSKKRPAGADGEGSGANKARRVGVEASSKASSKSSKATAEHDTAAGKHRDSGWPASADTGTGCSLSPDSPHSTPPAKVPYVEQERAGSEGGSVRGRRFIGVQKVAGRDEWSCIINPSLRYACQKSRTRVSRDTQKVSCRTDTLTLQIRERGGRRLGARRHLPRKQSACHRWRAQLRREQWGG